MAYQLQCSAFLLVDLLHNKEYAYLFALREPQIIFRNGFRMVLILLAIGHSAQLKACLVHLLLRQTTSALAPSHLVRLLPCPTGHRLSSGSFGYF